MSKFNFQENSLSTLRRIFWLYPRKDRQKLLIVSIIQLFLGLLDLAGVIFIGVLGALAVSGIGAQTPGDRVSAFLRLLRIEDLSLQNQAIILGTAACIFFVGKTLVSMFLLKKILKFLAFRASELSSNLLKKLFSQSLPTINLRSRQETLYSLTSGVQSVTVGVIGTIVSMISDISLLIILSIGLFVVNPIIATCTLLVFSAIGFLLYRILQVRAKHFGKIQVETTIQSNQSIFELIDTYREQIVRNRRGFYLGLISDQRKELAETSAQLAYMPFIGKYVLEISMVFGGLLISLIQFSIATATHAVATLSIFLVASSRLAPAVLRVQQGLVTIKGALVSGQRTLNLADEMSNVTPENHEICPFQLSKNGFRAEIQVDHIYYSYPGSNNEVLTDVSFKVEPGEMVAIVGPSGSGKSTLVDLILGVMDPTRGEIIISELSPRRAFTVWQGSIAYVPQDIRIVNGSIRDNILLGYGEGEDLDEHVWKAIEQANLDGFVKTLPAGLNTSAGDMGSKLSGGQRQRLGIARALISDPSLIVFDEATSALDSETESKVSSFIQNLKGVKSTLIIAHRLSTVRQADKVIYLENGKIECMGTFDYVRRFAPSFDRQASLMGLD